MDKRKLLIMAALLGGAIVAALLWWLTSPNRPEVEASSSHADAGHDCAQASAKATTTTPRAKKPSRVKWSAEQVAQRRKKWEQRRKNIREARDQRLRAASEAAKKKASQAYMKYTPKLIKDEMREIIPLIKECYHNALVDAGPQLQGKLVVKYVISGEPSVGGIIEEVQIDTDRSDALADNPSLAQCVTETIYTMEFDAPPSGGGTINVAYPLFFKSKNGDTDADADASEDADAG